jgi:hypothetical protein
MKTINLIVDRNHNVTLAKDSAPSAALSPLAEHGSLTIDTPTYREIVQAEIVTPSGKLNVAISGGGAWPTCHAGGCEYEDEGIAIRILGGTLNGFSVGERGKFSGVR